MRTSDEGRNPYEERGNPYEWWFSRPKWLKYTLAVCFIGVSAGLWIAGWIWPWSCAIG